MSANLLPPELWLDIASNLSTKDLLPLFLINRRFSQVLLPTLYSTIRIKFPALSDHPRLPPGSQTLASCTALAELPAGRLLQTLESHPELHAYVRCCWVIGLSSCTSLYGSEDLEELMDVQEYDRYHGAVLTLIGRLPRLQTLHLYHSHLRIRWILHLAIQPSLRLSITMNHCALYGEDTTDEPFTLSKLSYSYIFGSKAVRRSLHSIAFHAPIQHLGIGNNFKRTFANHMQAEEPLLSHLKVLELATPELRLNDDFFKSTPNLTTLDLIGNVESFTWTNLPHGAIHKLETFKGDSRCIPMVTAGRSVTQLVSNDPKSGTALDLYALGPHFGSNKPLRIVTWTNCIRPAGLLQYILDHNPEIQDLKITPLLGSELYLRVSTSIFYPGCPFVLITSTGRINSVARKATAA